MEIIADLQIHSKHARATSKDLSFENLEKFGRIKGVNLFGVGDFQHPEHRKEISRKLKEDDKGILRTKTGFPFLWQTEVSLMYSEDGKRRAVHLLIFAPNGIIADKIISYLGSKGRLEYDGRPIFGIQCKDLVRDLKDIDDKIFYNNPGKIPVVSGQTSNKGIRGFVDEKVLLKISLYLSFI